jgi:hypothetical protein
MQLPFLQKSKQPMSNPDSGKLREEKTVNGSPGDMINDQCAGEAFNAVDKKDATQFREAIKALVMNMIPGENHATPEG